MTVEPPSGSISPPRIPSVDHRSVAVLGVVTIVAYGTWFYAFGVLFDPILTDTGWNEALLAASYSIGVAAQGLMALFGGPWLDRVGSRRVLMVGGVGAGASMVATSLAPNLALFAIGAALTMAFMGFGFYHVTMTAVVRLNPDVSAKAIAELTIWGAFASFIYLPTTAALVDWLEWRTTMRVLAVVGSGTLVIAGLALPQTESEAHDRPAGWWTALRSTVDRPDRRAFTFAIALGSVAMSTIVVYQVPVMSAAGLPLAAAATAAGARGVFQTAGRLPLGLLLGWLGTTRSMTLAMVSIALGGVLLAFSGQFAIAMVFALVAGFGIGAMSPLQGILVEELFDRETLGSSMGAYSLVATIGGATGPVLAGFLADSSGDRRLATVIVVICAAAAALFAGQIRPAATKV